MRAALITGGTSGIGLAFARALAREGRPLVLVARDTDRLNTVAGDLSHAYGVDVSTLAADLSDRADVARVADRLRAGDIDLLINNAGFSLKEHIVGGDDERTDLAYEAMGRTPRVLASAAAPAMVARGEGRIINVVSVSALTRQDSYSALKAYALAISEVLANELAGTGVTVTAVLPGWVRTEFHDRAGINASKLPGFVWIEADKLVRSCLADAEKGRIESIPDLKWKIAMFIGDHGPRGLARLVSRMLTASRKKH